MSGGLHAVAALPLRVEPPVGQGVDSVLSGVQRQSERFRENNFLPCWASIRVSSVVLPVV